MQMLLVSLSMLLVCSFTAAAQVTVTGTVQDETGDPLPGVTVMVKGTSTGTSTNIDGQYTINAPADGTLTFTYVGMEPLEVKVAGKTTINVTMKEDSKVLDEVVVVGYGQQKKVTMTGAVSAVGAKDIVKSVGSNLSQALTGKLPGLITMQSSGRPGSDGVSLLVRGYSSYNDAGTVMCIIDGVDRGSRGLGEIDPNDVESISILKDAASCAIYGMKAANGVIIITTKRGQEGKANINYRGTVTMNHATALPKMMNGTQYMEWYNLAQVMDGTDPANVKFTPEMIEATYNNDLTDGIENTNWASPFEKNTLATQHNLSISGGTQKSRYFLSGGFMKQDAIIKDMDFQRANFRSNVSVEIGKMFDVMFNVAATVSDSKDNSGHQMAQGSNGVGGFNIENVWLYSLPYVPKNYYMCDPSDPLYGAPTGAFRNPSMNPEYSVGNSGFHKTRNLSLNTAGRVDWKAPFLPGFKASFAFAWDWRDLSGKSFNYSYSLMNFIPGDMKYTYGPAVNLADKGGLVVSDQKMQTVMIRPSISYTHTFAGKHNVDALLLYERTTDDSSLLSATSWDFLLYDLPYLSLAETIRPNGHSESAGYTAVEGYAGRFSYNYDEKYLAEFAFRYDGSYKFAPGNRYGFFPSGSLGWVITKEDWAKEFLGQKVDFLKIRGSIGKTGNDNVGSWLYRRLANLNQNAMAFGTTPLAGPTFVPETKYLQFDLTWEKTITYNIGAELTMWNGLLGAEFDWFYKYTYDILTGVGGVYAPSLAGNYPSVDSQGRFDNRGFELVLRHTNRIGKVGYNINANLTWAHNKVLRKTESAGVLPWQSALGSSIGQVFGYKTDGLFQTQDELDAAPRYEGAGTPRLGDIKFVDLNGDGIINSKDMTYIGHSPRPEMMFALNAEANWNGFDISFQFQGAAICNKFLAFYGNGGVADAGPLARPFYAGVDNSALHVVEGSWRPDNTNASYPRLSHSPLAMNYSRSDFWKRNGAYLRLKNATIGYTIPKRVTKKACIENARFFVSGMNLFTITDYKYLDPESGNYTWSFYPQQRTVTFGLDLSF
ncbi:MAG: TonB-dependent receptor [Muribaculaceae bacterium]|nr:TonB-dependent receptor [Muribaculaceae bacterium]